MVEDGREYNPETAQDLRPRDFQFVAHGEAFRFTLQIPEYILGRFTSDMWDRLERHMEDYAGTVVLDAMRGGYLTSEDGRSAMRRNVGRQLKDYIWQKFSITQERSGDEAWQTAPTLQRVHTS